VDAARIGLWGGSYGGYLTALGLGRDSDLFATGVDLHGVHDFTADGGRRFGRGQWRYEVTEEELARRADIAWRASPVAWVDSWRSPVLLIHGDDDRNVDFHQTVDLARRLQAKGVPFEEMVLPDEIHDFLRHESWMRADSATAAWFDRHFGAERGSLP
jgi:dipeptidyl aminopeptidase/acylaminoacyl peptidase